MGGKSASARRGSGMNRPPDMESPPALGAGGQGAIAVGALAIAIYADGRAAGKPGDCITVPRAIIEHTVSAMIDWLDTSDGQDDLEDDDPAEATGDDLGDTAWIEWHRTPANLRRQGQPGIMAGQEDDEPDDPPEDDDPREQDEPDSEHDGCEADAGI
jgi:hypothetical protein